MRQQFAVTPIYLPTVIFHRNPRRMPHVRQPKRIKLPTFQINRQVSRSKGFFSNVTLFATNQRSSSTAADIVDRNQIALFILIVRSYRLLAHSMFSCFTCLIISFQKNQLLKQLCKYISKFINCLDKKNYFNLITIYTNY